MTCYLDDGHLCYEYNLFILSPTKIRSADKLPPGRATITVTTRYAGPFDVTSGPRRVQLETGSEDGRRAVTLAA